jgi:hypothetical protein
MLLQRIYALEARVTTQDQRILHLETEIKSINGPLQHFPVESHPIIQDIQAKISNIASATPNPLSSEIEIQTPQPSIILPVHMITNRRNPSAPG